MSNSPIDEHHQAVAALGTQLFAVINAQGLDSSVVLDALLSCYISAAMNTGRLLECATHMVQQGGQFLMEDAMAKQAAGTDPNAPPPIRH